MRFARPAGRSRGTLFWSCAGLLLCSLLLGGGTRSGFLSDAVLELVAVPVLLISLARLLKTFAQMKAGDPQMRRALMLCAAIAAVPLIQLIPLPPWMWRSLPGREAVSALLDLTGRGGLWMPVSTSPASTWLSALSLLPPLAIFLCTIQLEYRKRRVLSLLILATGILSAFIGLLQIAQGPSSSLRPFAVTNALDAVGFFANRNHFAALLYVVLLFAAVWAVDGISPYGFELYDLSGQERTGAGPAKVLTFTTHFLVFVLLIAALVMARSRAGIVFTVAALAVAFGLAAGDRRAGRGAASGRLLIGAVTVAAMLALQFGLYRLADRFIVDPLQDARIPLAHNTIEAAKTFMPFGAGVGAFVPVYAIFEKPQTAFTRMYANHAHNDFLEVWLETGVAGILLAGLFLLWIVRASAIWWQRPAGMQAIDHSLARAGLAVVGLLVAHSFVDYPLRTGAIGAIFAFACALLVPPPGGSGRNGRPRHTPANGAGSEAARPEVVRPEKAKPEIARPERSGVRETSAAAHRSETRQATGRIDSPEASAAGTAERHGANIDWREKWRRQTAQNRSGDT